LKAAAWFRPASGILISDRQSSGRSKQRCSAYLSQLRSISPVQEPPHSSSLPLPKTNMSLINMKLKPLIAQVEGKKTFLPPSHPSYLSLPPRNYPQEPPHQHHLLMTSHPFSCSREFLQILVKLRREEKKFNMLLAEPLQRPQFSMTAREVSVSCRQALPSLHLQQQMAEYGRNAQD